MLSHGLAAAAAADDAVLSPSPYSPWPAIIVPVPCLLPAVALTVVLALVVPPIFDDEADDDDDDDGVDVDVDVEEED